MKEIFLKFDSDSKFRVLPPVETEFKPQTYYHNVGKTTREKKLLRVLTQDNTKIHFYSTPGVGKCMILDYYDIFRKYKERKEKKILREKKIKRLIDG